MLCPHHQLLCGVFTQEIELDPAILVVLTDEATLATVVQSQHSVFSCNEQTSHVKCSVYILSMKDYTCASARVT